VTAQQDSRGDVAVLVVAAGLGVRLGPGGPKALRSVAGQPLLVHAVRRVLAAPSVARVIVAAPPGGVGRLLGPEVTVVEGGATRQASVAAALAAVPDGLDIVLVHDAARALAPTELVEAVAAAVRGGHDAVIPVLPVVDTVKEVAASGAVVGTVDRSVLRTVQTPQGFRRSVLVAAHAAAADEHTDDAGMVEKLGLPVHTVPGHEAAFKITKPLDLVLAEALLR
jgi:2-C-methyl-D-erythritol 4-phosphate cytidylyltransferase